MRIVKKRPHRRQKDGIEPRCSLAEVAAVLGLSRQRVGQIEIVALAKLRAELDARGLTFAFLFQR